MTATEADSDRIRRLEQAADWLQQLQGRQHDEGLVERWLDWCARDRRNQLAFDEISGIWEATASATPAADATGPVAPAPSRRRVAWALAAGVAGLAAGLLAALVWARWHPATGESMLALASPPGINTRTELPDGSVVDLGGGSGATVAFSPQQRVVQLHGGQLFVAVSHDSERPFIVDAGGLQVRAVGTAFDVLREGSRTVVTVMEGRTDVRLATGGAQASPIRLNAGQQLTYVPGAPSVPVRWVDPSISTAWRTGVLQFVDEPLEHVVATINRYVAREILIEDRSIGALAFTGTAHIDRIESWLAALPDAFPVSVVDLPDGRRLLGARLKEARKSDPEP